MMGLDAMIFILRMLSFKPAYGKNVKIGGETSGVPPLRYTLISSSQLHQVLEAALRECSMSSLKGHASLLNPLVYYLWKQLWNKNESESPLEFV